MTKIEMMYQSTVAALGELTPATPDFEAQLDGLISLLIKIKYASHQREIKPDGVIDWSLTDSFLKQVEAGMHQHGIIPGWQDKAVTK